MSKKPRNRPTLHPTQLQSPETLAPDEIAARRNLDAAAQERRGRDLLAEGARLLNSGEAAEAASYLEEAVRLLPDNPDAAVNLGGAYILQRRHNQAVRVLEAASQRHPDHVMLWVNLAAAYLGALELSGPQQQARAIAAYEKALALDGKTPHVHYNLGLIYHDRGDLDAARRSFELALETNPDDRDAQRWLHRLTQ
ncbi:MAG: tetratricopeptide repeat protein [Caldilineales bacterium]